MAVTLDNLIELAQSQVAREFKPYAYYGAEEDALTFYFSGEADYATHVNSRVTMFVGVDSGELVGCHIKSVRSVLDDLGWFDVAISPLPPGPPSA